jgi:hypothetical protein
MWQCDELPFGHDPTYLEHVNIPHPSVNVKPLFGGGTFTYYAGFVEISAFNATFYEDVGMRTAKWLTSWRNRIRNPESGAFFLPKDYKRDLHFTLFNTRGEPILRVQAKNCWPTTCSEWDWVPGDSEILKLEINFATDGINLQPA